MPVNILTPGTYYHHSYQPDSASSCDSPNHTPPPLPQWCVMGRCVTMGERPAAINGEWGSWSSWSQCTRSCGAGTQMAERHCDNPAPANGGRYCTGDRKRYRICNTEVCGR